MSSLSLNKSIRTCKVETGEANRIQTDRFFNPNNMVCVPWNGFNNKGQSVCPDSFFTKTPGCNSALDRVDVENFLRPDYSDYINLNLAGLTGDIYGNAMAWDKSGSANRWEQSRNKITGSYGNQFQSTNYQTCGLNAYERSMAQMSQNNRGAAYASNSYRSNQKRAYSGSC